MRKKQFNKEKSKTTRQLLEPLLFNLIQETGVRPGKDFSNFTITIKGKFNIFEFGLHSIIFEKSPIEDEGDQNGASGCNPG